LIRKAEGWPMPRQLDILALEPFYGGARRAMLETVIRCSRHRWTLLKLPPRRIERRLTAAANWFAEQLTRHWAGSVDLLFTSEALNLANLNRMMPMLAKKPSVVYFHSNELPRAGADGGALELVNLNTAAAATEIWFNSSYHLETFVERASSVVTRHAELSSRNPLPHLRAKAHVMLEPIDLSAANGIPSERRPARNPRSIFVETRDVDMELLNDALERLLRRGEKFKLITIGPVEQLAVQFDRRTISEIDEEGQLLGLLEAGVFLSVKRFAPADYLAIRAMVTGCYPLLPAAGCYLEFLPGDMEDQGNYLYELSAEELSTRLSEVLDNNPQPPVAEFRQLFHPFDALAACRAFDDRLQQIVESHAADK
jgi:hypothetical protein